jgi:predicted double-glycine peptidase
MTAALAALSAGCGHVGPPAIAGAPDGSGWTVVPGVPVITQNQKGEDDCGRAALTTVLARWGVALSGPGGSGANGVVPRDGGITAGALRDEARRRGFASFVFAGTLDDLMVEVGAGRPVVVGVVSVEGERRMPHFAVVAGHDASARRWLLVDPARGVRNISGDALRTEWGRSGWVTLVVYPNDSVPDDRASESNAAPAYTTSI